VLIGATQDSIHTTRVGMAAADLILGCDPIVTAGKETTLRMRTGRTHVALNSHSTPTAAFVKDAQWVNPAQACGAKIRDIVGEGALGSFDADALATRLMGDSIYTNPMMLGYAWQKGWIPLQRDSLLRAIELNAVAVENNCLAFEWGCQSAHNGEALQRLMAQSGSGGEQAIEFKKRDTLEQLIARRVEFLTGYQNAAYAQSYSAFVLKACSVEKALGHEKQSLSEAIARNLFKLMAYKDEYEVARLHADSAFRARIEREYEGNFKLHFHLAPPLIASVNDRGEMQKRKFGPSMLLVFRVLARLKGLRGTPLDIFGRTQERQTERALILEYRASMDEVLKGLTPANYVMALELARIPEQISGYGHVKQRRLAAVRLSWSELLVQWRQSDHPLPA
jgi:indolepyruvate ferredoxin oxidoreductase